MARMSDVLQLRRAGAADAAAVRALTREAYARWVPLLGREPQPMSTDFAEAIRNHQIDLAYLGAELAGLIERLGYEVDGETAFGAGTRVHMSKPVMPGVQSTDSQG